MIMKKIIMLLAVLFIGLTTVTAQNNEAKADDAARIAITPQVSDQAIPQATKNLLINKMKQICTKNGMSGEGENPFFVMDVSIDVLTKDITPSAPPMHALTLSVNFEIKDNMSGNVYSQTSIEVKGVGKNETKAYMEAVKVLNTNAGQFKAFVEKGKEKILEFYNSECDFIISRAKALHQQGENNKAIKVLESVPSVSKECYDMCMELLSEIEPVQEVAPSGSAPVQSQAVSSSSQSSEDNSAAKQENISTPAASVPSVSTTTTVANTVSVGSKLMVESDKETRFQYKKYSPAKVKTVATDATKGEYQVLAMGDCSTEEIWSKDVIFQWHQATTENIKEGMLVLYTAYDREMNETSCFHIGKVIAVDELYKNLVTIKGWYEEISKVNPEKILIVDKSNIEQ